MPVKLAGREIVGPKAWKSTQATGSASAWRAQRPLLDIEACTGCMVCWKFCPEPAITPHEGKVSIDLGACKGCGVCAHECPVDAIRMEEEVVE